MNKGPVVTTALVLNLIAHINRLHGLDRLLMYCICRAAITNAKQYVILDE